MTGALVAERYLLGPRLEKTWLGERFLAEDQVRGEQCELELWRAAGKQEEQLLRLVGREVEISEWLGPHKDVIRALAWGQLPTGWIYVVREASPDTRPVNLRRGELDDRVWRLLTLCQLVDNLTQKGIVHRDLGPKAFLEHEQEDLRLSRLYLAKLDEVHEPWVGPWGLPQAEIRCAAPELIDRPSEATPAADVFGLGVLMFRALTGKWPFRGASVPQLVRRHLEVAHGREAPPRPSQLAAIPAGLDALCARALALDPEARFPTPGDMAQALEDFLAVGGDGLADSASDLGALDLTEDPDDDDGPDGTETDLERIEVPDPDPDPEPVLAIPADALANSGVEFASEDLTPEEHLVLPELPDAPPPVELDLPEVPQPVTVQELISAQELLTASDVGLTMEQGAIVLAVEAKLLDAVVEALAQLDPEGVQVFLMDMSQVPHLGGAQLEALTAVFTLCEQKGVRSAMYAVRPDVARMIALLELQAHVPDIVEVETTEEALAELDWVPATVEDEGDEA
ncbi:MAG: STAS domain-containing protein [Planctomycetota bacterium]